MDIQNVPGASFEKPEPASLKNVQSVQELEGLNESVSFSDKEKESLSLQTIDTGLLETINQKLLQANTGVAFEVDVDTKAFVLKVVDKTTNDVIKQFPNEEALKVMKHLQTYLNSVNNQELSSAQSLTGALFNEII